MGWKSTGGRANGVADGRGIGDGLDEFEELRGVDDRVGKRGLFDQLFLNDLSAHVGDVGQTLRSHYRQCNVMPYARSGFTPQHVAGGRLEELHHRLFLE
jgi:hypothetical protein